MNENPILNNPYREPEYHYNVDADGNLDYNSIIQGRRPYIGRINISPNAVRNSQLFNAEDVVNDVDADFINGLRKEVKSWREKGYPTVTRVTRELLNFWFNNPERMNYQNYFSASKKLLRQQFTLTKWQNATPTLVAIFFVN